MITLQRLETLRQVARSGSFTAAAETLGHTQSAVSQQIAALEQGLGVSLVARRPRRISLTPAGRLLLERGNGILDDVERASSDVRALAGVVSGEIRVATVATAAATLLPTIIARFRERYPDARIRLDDADPDESLPALMAGSLDLAVVFDFTQAPLEPDPLVQLDLLCEETLFIGVARTHPLAERKRVRIRDFADEPWIGGNAQNVRRVLSRLSSTEGFKPRVVLESEDYGMVQGMIAAGMGVALLPALATFYLHPEVVAVPLVSRVGRRRIQLATLDVPVEAALVRAFSAILRKNLASAARRFPGVHPV